MCRDDGVVLWRPVLASLTVHRAGDERHLIVREDGEERHRFRLSKEAAGHLAELLTRAA